MTLLLGIDSHTTYAAPDAAYMRDPTQLPGPAARAY